MRSLSALRLAAALGLSLSAASLANATLWQWNWTPLTVNPSQGYNAAGGAIEFINSSFDTTTKRLTFEVQFQGTLTTRGFWLALNGGPNPKNQPGEYALFYFDGTSFASPKLTAYNYNGLNNGSSWNDANGAAAGTPRGNLIKGINEAGFINSITAADTAGKRRFFFDINATDIINFTPNPTATDGSPWFGTGFANQLGIWFHTLTGPNFAYNSTFSNGDPNPRGGLTNFSNSGKEGWLDGEFYRTIPAPGSVALLGMGGLIAARRRRAA
jgi:hypothetical protein